MRPHRPLARTFFTFRTGDFPKVHHSRRFWPICILTLSMKAWTADVMPGSCAYADDFVILARSGKHAEKRLPTRAPFFADLGLTLNDSKTRLSSFDQGFRYLGPFCVRSM